MGPLKKLELAFPQEEYDRRLAAVREGMAAKGVEVLLVFDPANVTYLTGYYTISFYTYQCLLVPMEGMPVLVVRGFEVPVAEASSWLDSVFGYADHEDPASALLRAIRENGFESRKLFAEQTSPFMTVRQYKHLEKNLGLEMGDGTGFVEPVRMIKSSWEVECFRSAAKCTEAGMAAGIEAVAEGKTENEVVAECYRGLAAAGSEFFSLGPILTSGDKSGIPHTTFQRRKLLRGDAVFFEHGGVWHRYTAPLMRTAVVGEPSDGMRRMYDACAEALEATLAAIRPGALSEDAQAACQAVIDRNGYEPNFRRRVGYAVGLSFGPGWPEAHIMSLGPHDKRELRPGMVFHVPLALREYGEYAVGVSETVAVTEKGLENITNFPRDLFIRG